MNLNYVYLNTIKQQLSISIIIFRRFSGGWFKSLYLACSSSDRCLPMMAKVWGRFCFTFSCTWGQRNRGSQIQCYQNERKAWGKTKTKPIRQPHLHSGDVDLLSDAELLSHQPEFRHAVKHHVVELERRWTTQLIISADNTDPPALWHSNGPLSPSRGIGLVLFHFWLTSSWCDLLWWAHWPG